jgi:hypothetical protein
MSEGKSAAKERQRRRLAEALRQNLKRRKAQSAVRTGAKRGDAGPRSGSRPESLTEPHDSAGIVADKRRE